MRLISAPSRGVVRIAYRAHESFEPPPWNFQAETGRLLRFPRNRFDDIGPSLGLPQHEWFQTIYAATKRDASFGELLSSRRVYPLAARLAFEFADLAATPSEFDAGLLDPTYPTHGQIPVKWRSIRDITGAHIPENTRFIDVSHPATLSFLLDNFLPAFLEREPSAIHFDFDLSDVMSRNRTLTQHLARYLRDLPRDAFVELKAGEKIAGIRYLSRHSPDWECWALFADRIEGNLKIGESRTIEADDPDLFAVARHFGLSVETDSPGEFLRPWLNP